MSELLIQAATIGGVQRLAIVDDAYDPPRAREISENAFNQFVQAVEEHETTRTAVEDATSITDDDLDDYELFADNEILLGELWALHTGTKDNPIDARTRTALRALFSDVELDRASKLAQLKPLEKLLEAVGKPVARLGSNAEPTEAAKADVVFLDLYLSNEVPSEPASRNILSRGVYDRARERAIEYLKSVRQVTARDPKAISPAFILISSLGSNANSESFRRRAGQAMSRFRFVQKQTLAEPQLHGLLAIADIFRTCAACGFIEPIHKAWPKVLDDSRKWIDDLLLELDISDFGRLYHLRLQKEGQPLEEYFKELIAGALAERVSLAFGKVETHVAKSPFESVPNFFEPPSNGFADLFSATRITQALGFRGSTALDPQSGDIYLEGPLRKTRNPGRLVGRKVFAVMSPPCDLIDRTGAGPAAKSVLLLEGTVRAVTNETDHLMVFIARRYYEIAWSFKHPQTITIEALREQKRRGRKTWLGRLKAEHFLSIQSEFLGSLGRIGVLKSPAVFEVLGGEISARQGQNRIVLGSFNGDRQFAYLCPDRGKHAVFFTGHFLQYFVDLLTAIRDGNGHQVTLKSKAKGLLERMPRIVSMIEIGLPTHHKIQNYLAVEFHLEPTQEIAEAGEGVFVIRLQLE